MPMPMRNVEAAADPMPVEAPVAQATQAQIATMGQAIVYVESPVRELHRQLSTHFETSGAAAAAMSSAVKWPGSLRLAFIVGASAALWGMIGVALTRVV